MADLKHEHQELSTHIEQVTISDEQVNAIETYCNEISTGIDQASFEDKRRYFDMLNLRVRLAIEDDEKIAYVECKIGQTRLTIVPTLS